MGKDDGVWVDSVTCDAVCLLSIMGRLPSSEGRKGEWGAVG